MHGNLNAVKEGEAERSAEQVLWALGTARAKAGRWKRAWHRGRTEAGVGWVRSRKRAGDELREVVGAQRCVLTTLARQHGQRRRIWASAPAQPSLTLSRLF